jgi:thiol:disulfide interchange protein DsbD
MRRLGVALLVVLGAACWTVGPVVADATRVSLSVTPDERTVARGAAVGVEAVATIAPGWHINAHQPDQPFLKPTTLTLTVPAEVRVDPVTYPQPDRRKFAFAGDTELLVYEGKPGLTTALYVPTSYGGDRLHIEAVLQYQACNDTTCERPTTVSAEAELRVVEPAAAADSAGTASADTADVGSDSAVVLSDWLARRGLVFTLAAVALLGLGLNLTPCVYPLISVTIAYFGGQARGRGQVVGLAALYVLGIALSFSVMGLAAALSGGVFGAALQKPPVVLFIAAVMIALALASFGVYQLQPPAALLRRVGGAGSGAAGALFMGLTMGIVAAPCVGPIVVGLLVFVGSRQDAGLGFLLFFVLALGMGLPYLALAAVAGSLRRLPRSGEWLLWTERLFGCILLSLAAYYLATLLPGTMKPWLLPVVIGLSGLYLGFVERAGRAVRSFRFVKAAVGIGMLAIAAWLAQPVSITQAIAWEPYEQWSSPEHGPDSEKPLLLDFAAEWCIPCREMDHTTYAHPEVVREANRFHMVKADITQDNESTSALVAKYDVKGVPTVILFSPRGNERSRMVGYVGPDEMLAAMRAVR